MRSMILYGILAATAAFTAACTNSDSVAPTIAPATTHFAFSADADGGTTMWRPVDQYIWLSCANGGAGETVHVTGDLRYALHRTQEPSGVTHLNIKSNTSGLSAVGLTTGTLFRGMMAERSNSRASDELNMDVRTTDEIRFVTRAGSDSYSLIVSSHFVVDQGTYVLAEQTWKEGCR